MKIARTVHDEHFDVMQTRRFKALRTIIVINFFGHGMWDLAPRPGIKPLPPALAGGFFTTEPPGKPPDLYLSIK